MSCPHGEWVLWDSSRHHLSPAGGSLAGDTPGDPELYVRWLQLVTFLPVMAFSTPPWLCCDAWVRTPGPYVTNTPKSHRGPYWGKLSLKITVLFLLPTNPALCPSHQTAAGSQQWFCCKINVSFPGFILQLRATVGLVSTTPVEMTATAMSFPLPFAAGVV